MAEPPCKDSPESPGAMRGFGVYTFYACHHILAWSEAEARQTLVDYGCLVESQLPVHISFKDGDHIQGFKSSLLVPDEFETIYGPPDGSRCDWTHVERVRELVYLLEPILSAPSTFPRVAELDLGREEFLAWCWSTCFDQKSEDNTTAYYLLRFPKLREVFLAFRWKYTRAACEEDIGEDAE